MKTNKYIVFIARNVWFWFWNRLMDGFAPSDKDGNYKRPKGFKCEKNFKIKLNTNESLYLLLGATCPWSHRTVLASELRQMYEIKKIYLKPNLNTGEWIFKNNFFGFKSLNCLYKKSNKGSFLRPTVPVLIKKNKNELEFISNESSEIIEILSIFDNSKKQTQIQFDQCEKQFLEKIHNEINNGVYKCGFARNQASYRIASNKLFQSLFEIDSLIQKSGGPWIFGNKLSYADLYLFPTIIRWELIYSKLFKCTEREISEYKNILKWRINFYKLKGVPETCFENEWVQEYYKGLFPLNPNQIVPIQSTLKEILSKNID